MIFSFSSRHVHFCFQFFLLGIFDSAIVKSHNVKTCKRRKLAHADGCSSHAFPGNQAQDNALRFARLMIVNRMVIHRVVRHPAYWLRPSNRQPSS